MNGLTKSQKSWFLFGFFGCFGITAEVFFTAIFGFHHDTTGILGIVKGLQHTGIDWRLMGGSYAWMFPIYGLSGWLFPPLMRIIHRYSVPVRMTIYMIGIYAVELISGWILDMLIGSCPWDYRGPHIFKYINPPHAPAWMAMGLGIEKIIIFFDNIIKIRE
jgi:hypothetical protein